MNPERKKKWNEYHRQRLEQQRLDAGEAMLQCKICGKWFRQIGSHVTQTHNMTAREYREYIGVDVKKGLLPDDLRKLYGDQAKENGTWQNLKRGKKYYFKSGDNRAGFYKRSPQTLERLNEQLKKARNRKK